MQIAKILACTIISLLAQAAVACSPPAPKIGADGRLVVDPYKYNYVAVVVGVREVILPFGRERVLKPMQALDLEVSESSSSEVAVGSRQVVVYPGIGADCSSEPRSYGADRYPIGAGVSVRSNRLDAGFVELVSSPITTPASFHNRRDPLAGQAGLERAVENGVLRRANLDDAANWINALKKKYELQNRPPPNIPPDLNNAFVVLKEFTYPGGLYGRHSATFYIPKGVPWPTGDYGHSRVYDLNSISLECNAGSACGESMSRGEIGAGSTQQHMIIGK